MTKLILTVLLAVLVSFSAVAQTPKDVKYFYTEASELNLIGKILEDTPNPYHRVDTVRYKGFTEKENLQVRCPAGLAVLFKTNSTTISVKADYAYLAEHNSTMSVATRGFGLYIKKDGKWLYAYSRCNSMKDAKNGKELVMLKDMDDRGKTLNMAFAVSAAFVFGDHLGFTAGFAPEMLLPVMAAKLTAGIAAIALALLLTGRKHHG